MEEGNNGHGIGVLEDEILKEVAHDLDNMKEIGSDSMSPTAKLGVLQKIITAIVKDDDYRQVLLLGCFDSKQEAMLASDAISERKRYGVDITPIVDRVIAQCAIHADRVEKALKGMTHYNLNNQGGGGPGWFKKQKDKSIA